MTNLQGDVVKIIGTSGMSYAEYSYNAWGEVLTATGTLAAVNPLRYRGYYYDTETKLYYLQSRYYDPALCRFINADGLASIGQGVVGCNMFAYCNNNPVNQTDTLGRFPLWLIPLFVIPFLSGCSNDSASYPSDYIKNNDNDELRYKKQE